ncbi:MAG: DUF4058 family protein [Pirellulales bacterium]
MPRSLNSIDPYVEDQGYWRDFHLRFLNACADALAEAVPESYEPRLEEEIKLISHGVEEVAVRKALPDVAILRGDSVEPSGRGGGGVATLEPVTVELPVVAEVREAWIEIYRRPGRELVTVIEVLSPSNKDDRDRELYLAKRNALLIQKVHLVELDFLLRGERLPMRRRLPTGDFYALVSRHERRPKSDVYVWRRDEPLPPIPIPLKAPDPDVTLDLAAVYKTAYERGRYAKSIDYSRPLPE